MKRQRKRREKQGGRNNKEDKEEGNASTLGGLMTIEQSHLALLFSLMTCHVLSTHPRRNPWETINLFNTSQYDDRI